MLDSVKQRQLAKVDREWEEVCFARTRFTGDFSKNGIEEWDRLFAQAQELEKEHNKLVEEGDSAKS